MCKARRPDEDVTPGNIQIFWPNFCGRSRCRGAGPENSSGSPLLSGNLLFRRRRPRVTSFPGCSVRVSLPGRTDGHARLHLEAGVRPPMRPHPRSLPDGSRHGFCRVVRSGRPYLAGARGIRRPARLRRSPGGRSRPCFGRSSWPSSRPGPPDARWQPWSRGPAGPRLPGHGGADTAAQRHEGGGVAAGGDERSVGCGTGAASGHDPCTVASGGLLWVAGWVKRFRFLTQRVAESGSPSSEVAATVRALASKPRSGMVSDLSGGPSVPQVRLHQEAGARSLMGLVPDYLRVSGWACATNACRRHKRAAF